MRYLTLTLLIVLANTLYAQQSFQNDRSIYGISYKNSINLAAADKPDPAVDFFYYKNMRMVQWTIPGTKTTIMPPKNGKNEETRMDSIINHYYLFWKKDSPKGKYYRWKPEPEEVKVDSMLKVVFGYDEKMLLDDNNQIVEQKQGETENIVVEKYIPKVKTDTCCSYTMYLHFDKKFRATEFSLSKELDSLKKMKLVKGVIHFNPYFDNKLNQQIPQREFVFEMKELTNVKEDEILALFKRFSSE